MVGFLETGKKVDNQKSFCIIVKELQTMPLTHPGSNQVFTAYLSYCVANTLHTSYPELWAVLVGRLNDMMAKSYVRFVQSGLDPVSWWQLHSAGFERS